MKQVVKAKQGEKRIRANAYPLQGFNFMCFYRLSKIAVTKPGLPLRYRKP